MTTARSFSAGKIIAVAALLLWGLVGVACQGKLSSDGASSANSTAGPSAVSPSGNSALQPDVDGFFSDMPRCPGMQKLDALKFDWPDIENVLDKLADYTWGYFRCDLTQPELSALYRGDMVKPPYLWREVNHAEHNNGIVVLFYHPSKVTWNYIWMLPRSEAQSSYLIISRSAPGEPQAWECRRSLPETVRAIKGG